MIVSPELKEVDQVDVTANRAEVSHDPPPAYVPGHSNDLQNLPPFPSAAAPAPPDSVKPTNHLSLRRSNGSIKGTYVIDPRLKVPPQMLPPLAADETEETRRNLSVHSRHGGIDLDLWVIATTKGDADSAPAPGRVRMLIESSNGGVAVRVHTTGATSRPPIHLIAHTSNGHITVALPRTFRGPLTLRSRWPIRLSRALAAATTTFADAGGTRRCFVGDFSEWDGEELSGDEAAVETSNGTVKIQFDAEDGEEGEKGRRPGFLGRLLGL